MKITRPGFFSSRGAFGAAALTMSILGAVIFGGVSVQAASTNYYWNVLSPDNYTNDADWVGAAAPMGAKNLAPGGSVNYVGYITNAGTINYGDGGNGPATGYTWTNALGGLLIGTNGDGAFSMSSGSLTVSNAGANVFILGPGTNSTGSFSMTGGSFTAIRDASTFFQDFAIIGNSTNGTGTGFFTISGGFANFLCGIEIGNGGSGTFNINGGLVVDNGWFGVGRGGTSGTNSQGTFNMTAGTFYILRNTGNDGSGLDNGVYMAQGSSNSVVNISGGNLYAIRIAMGGPAIGPTTTLNISGGNLGIGYLGVSSNGASVESVNISGGTFHTADFQVITAANIGSTNSVTALGTNWTWAVNPQVNLTNSSFLVNGSSGPGNVTFAPEAARTITLNNRWNGVGGLVLNGPGSLTLGTADSFSGGVTVSQGTLNYNTVGQNYTGGTIVSQGTLVYNVAQPGAIISGTTFGSGATLILASAQTNAITGVATFSGNNTLQLNAGGTLVEGPVTLPAGSTFVFNETGTVNFTNILTGPENVTVSGTGTINVGNTLQNTGTIVQKNGALVLNGAINNASSVSNVGPATAGPFVAQGTIVPPLTINTNSAIDLGTTVVPGTLTAGSVTLNGAWNFKLNTATTVGGGVNDLLICTNLTLNPSSVLNILSISPPSVGTYVIAQYSGTLTGTFGTLTNATRDAMTLDYSTPGEILLHVNSSNPANLTWATPLIGGSNQWDVSTTTNWLNAGALDTFHQQDAVTFSAAANPALTNRVVVTTTVLPSSITISGGLPYLFSGTGHISGGTGITYNDTNTTGIFTLNNDYTGPVNINAGVLQLGSGGSSWLGSTNGSTTVNGGTLDLNAQSVGAEPLIIQGSGGGLAGTNGGAINNSSATASGQSGGPLNITLAGDTTLNASGARWDIGLNTLGAGGGSFTGNGHNLVKIGNQAIWMHEVGDIGVGNIDIQQGLLGFQDTIGMGLAGGTVTVEPGAILGIFNLNTNSILNKQLVLNGNATLQSGGNAGASNNLVGPVTLNGTNSITTSIFPLNLPGVISGTGGFQLTGAGPLYLGSVDTYSGLTVMGPNSRLVLTPGASIGNTPLIYMTPSTNIVLDAGVNTVTLNSGQTLVGSGSIIATNFVASAGSTISAGTNLAFGTIVFTNNLTLNGNTNNFKITDPNAPPQFNDLYQVNGNLTLSGVSTVNVTPLTGLLPQPYAIMQVNGTITGSAGNLHVVSLSPRYTMSAAINGQFVDVVPTGIPANLVWKGNLSSIWSYGTSNWFNLGTGQGDTFFIGDNPIFDDSTAVNTVTITNGILPAGIFMSNVVKTYTFNGAGIPSGTLNMEGNGSGTGGTLILQMTNAPAFSGIDAEAGTLIYNLQGITNYQVNALIGDNSFAGLGTIIFGGTNTAVLTANNAGQGFNGTIMVTNGVLQYTTNLALGVAGQTRLIVNGGTVDANGNALHDAMTHVQLAGNGFNGQGAFTDSKGGADTSGLGPISYFTLIADASVGAPGTIRWDQHNPGGSPGQINGQGFKLTKVGTGTVLLYGQSDGDIHMGDIDVAAGRLAFQCNAGQTLALGNDYPNNVLSVESGAICTFFAVSNGFDTVHAGVNKVMWLKGSAVLDSGGTSNNYIGPVFLTGTNLFGFRSDMHFWSSIMDTNGPGGLIMALSPVNTGNGNLWLDGTNSYSGPTILSNNTVHVGANSSLGLSTYVRVNSGATLDLSAMPVFNFGTVATNQFMTGNGVIIGPAAGNININAGGTLAVGSPLTNNFVNTNTFNLTISNALVFNSGSTYYVGVNKRVTGAATNASDHVVGLTSVTMGGTLVVTNYGISFVGGDVIPLFSSVAYVATGFTSNNIVPTTPGPNLAWDTSTLGVDGNLRIFSTLTVNPQPTNIVFSVSGGNLTLSWPADHTGWELQVQTNGLAVGISTNWTPIPSSTTVNSVVIPINLTNGTVLYRMVYPPQ